MTQFNLKQWGGATPPFQMASFKMLYLALLAALPALAVGDHCSESLVCPAIAANVEAILVSRSFKNLAWLHYSVICISGRQKNVGVLCS